MDSLISPCPWLTPPKLSHNLGGLSHWLGSSPSSSSRVPDVCSRAELPYRGQSSLSTRSLLVSLPFPQPKYLTHLFRVVGIGPSAKRTSWRRPRQTLTAQALSLALSYLFRSVSCLENRASVVLRVPTDTNLSHIRGRQSCDVDRIMTLVLQLIAWMTISDVGPLLVRLVRARSLRLLVPSGSRHSAGVS